MNTATYPGDCTDFDPAAYVGADTAGAFYRPIEATYDAETDVTTIRYRPIPPADMPRYGEPKMEQLYERARLIELFGGHW